MIFALFFVGLGMLCTPVDAMQNGCPDGHAMESRPAPKYGTKRYRCDICADVIPKRATFYYCSDCNHDYDVCKTCWLNEDPVSTDPDTDEKTSKGDVVTLKAVPVTGMVKPPPKKDATEVVQAVKTSVQRPYKSGQTVFAKIQKSMLSTVSIEREEGERKVWTACTFGDADFLAGGKRLYEVHINEDKVAFVTEDELSIVDPSSDMDGREPIMGMVEPAPISVTKPTKPNLKRHPWQLLTKKIDFLGSLRSFPSWKRENEDKALIAEFVTINDRKDPLFGRDYSCEIHSVEEFGETNVTTVTIEATLRSSNLWVKKNLFPNTPLGGRRTFTVVREVTRSKTKWIWNSTITAWDKENDVGITAAPAFTFRNFKEEEL